MVRTHHLLRSLSHHNDVRLFTQPRLAEFRGRDYPREIQCSGAYPEYRYTNLVSGALIQALRRPHASGLALRVTRPAILDQWLDWADVTIVEQPWQYAYVRRRNPHGLLVLATHNFEKATSASNAEAAGVPAERSFWYRHSVKTERFATRDADLVIAVSPEDGARFTSEYGADPARVVVAANAADTEHYAPVSDTERQALRQKHRLPDRPTVVFLASKPSPPHNAALDWVRRTAAAMPDYTFLVVGGLVAPSASGDNFIATGIVEDPAEFLKAADMAICPVEFGGGTKIKTLECVSVGLPTVVFAEAIHGTTLRSPEHVLLCTPDEQAVVSTLRRIGDDLGTARAMGAAGRAVIVEHYDWKASAAIMEQAINELAERHATRRA